MWENMFLAVTEEGEYFVYEVVPENTQKQTFQVA